MPTKKWIPYNNKEMQVRNIVSVYILKSLAKTCPAYYTYNEKIRPSRTQLIKDTLAELGHKPLPGKPRYKVYANGLSKHLTQKFGGVFKNREWLYDLHWYTEGIDPYTTVRLPLVMECEWKPKSKHDSTNAYSGIKYDFQKLLVSNAELRLMIFNLKNASRLDELTMYFENNISGYHGLSAGAEFLFVCFVDTTSSLYYLELKKI